LDEKGKDVLVKRVRTDFDDISILIEKTEDETNDKLAVVMKATGRPFRGQRLRCHGRTSDQGKGADASVSKTDENDDIVPVDIQHLKGLREVRDPSKELHDQRDLMEHREPLVRKKENISESAREFRDALDRMNMEL
jgi:hypothetical protein